MSVHSVRTDLALEAHENMEVVSENTHGITVDESYHENTETRITKVLVSPRTVPKHYVNQWEPILLWKRRT